jgi:hypothetical protein
MAARVSKDKLRADPLSVKEAQDAHTHAGAAPAPLREFTRHPKLLVKVRGMPWPAAVRFALECLLMFADKEGVCWIQVDGTTDAPGLVQLIPRSIRCAACTGLCMCGRPTKAKAYSKSWLRNALRQARKLGLVDWQRVKPFERFPSRDTDGAIAWGGGSRTFAGGRVWVLNLKQIAEWTSGTDLAGWTVHRLSGWTVHSPSSGSGSPSEILIKSDHRTPEGARGAAPTAPHAASETPRRSSVHDAGGRRLRTTSPGAHDDASPAAAGDVEPHRTATRSRSEASETPCAPHAAHASQPRPRSAPESKSTQGREHDSGRVVSPADRPVDAEQMKRDLQKLGLA